MTDASSTWNHEATACLACGSDRLDLALDLGTQAPANRLTDVADSLTTQYPLGLCSCLECGHGQLSYLVSPEVLFTDYLYKSGTSQTLASYFSWFCDRVTSATGSSGSVLEIGANDGSLLAEFGARGLRTTGIDPAANIVDESDPRFDRMICDFFPSPLLGDEKFDLIVGLNVLAHTPNPLGLLDGVREHLAPGGRAIFQTSQAMMLINGEFDTIYHEHYSFFTPSSLRGAANRSGLELCGLFLTDIHGTSFVFVLRHSADTRGPDFDLDQGRFAVARETADGLVALLDGSLESVYREFATKATDRMAIVKQLVEEKRRDGYQIAMVGAAAKAVTFSRAADISFDRAYDEAPEKLGLFIANSDLRIEPLQEVALLDGKVLFVITAWNFAEELEQKLRAVAHVDEALFLTYFPSVALW